MKYITINNWESYQQYKDRNPNWVKLNIDFIAKYNTDGSPKTTYKLTDTAKLTFVCLMCLRATFDKITGKIPYESDKELTQRLGLTKIDVQSLINSNLIAISNDSVQNCTELYENGTPENREQSKRTEKREQRNIYPTLEEFKKYIQDNKLNINNPENLFAGYNDSGWIDTQGKPVKNWKLKLRTLSGYTKPSEGAAVCVVDKKAGNKFQVNAKNEKVWLCEECLENLKKTGCLNFGKLPLDQIETLVLRGKAVRHE